MPRLAIPHPGRRPARWLPAAMVVAWSALAAVPHAAGDRDSRPLPARFRKGPYLIYTGDPTAMRVLWQADATVLCTLEWGTTTLYATGRVETAEYGDDHQHIHVIRNLSPATRYFYRVVLGDTAAAASFVTAPGAGATAVKFMLHGDTQANAASHDTVCAAMIETYQDDPAYQSLVLGVGDVSNFGMQESDWDDYFFNPHRTHIRERLAHVPFATAIGNHELYADATTYDLTAPLFRKYFPYPFVADRYWSFDYGPAHILIADLYPWYYDPGLPDLIPPGFISPEQAAWIEDDLGRTDRPWKLVVLHESGWSAGPHPNNPSVQDTLHPLCTTYGVDLVIAGHNHYYARAEVDDIPYLTTSGGAHLYAPGFIWPNIVLTSRNHHFVKIAIAGSVLHCQVVRRDGAIIDEFVLIKDSAVEAGAPPSNPLRLEQNSPNPFRTRTAIPFVLASPAAVSLRIYDVGGRLVRTLVDADLDPTAYRIDWDGRDGAGRRVGAGTYWYRLTTPERAAARKLVVE